MKARIYYCAFSNLFRALLTITTRNSSRIRSVGNLLVGIAAAISLAVSGLTAKSAFGTFNHSDEVISWRENYKAYKTTILSRTSTHIYTVTQFIPLGKYKFNKTSVGTATQKSYTGGFDYAKVVEVEKSTEHRFEIPKHSREWRSLGVLKISTEGHKFR